MMYGTVETDEERLGAWLRTCDETGLYRVHHGAISRTTRSLPAEATGVDYRGRSRLPPVLDNFDNLCIGVGRGGKVGQLSLAYGANDMQRHDRGDVVAPRLVCMDEVEIVQHRGRRLRGEAPEYVLRHPATPSSASDVPAAELATRGRKATPVCLILKGYPARPPENSSVSFRLIHYRGLKTGERSTFARRMGGRPCRSSRSASARRHRVHRIDLGEVAVMPGLVNAPHLELPARDECRRLSSSPGSGDGRRLQRPDPRCRRFSTRSIAASPRLWRADGWSSVTSATRSRLSPTHSSPLAGGVLQLIGSASPTRTFVDIARHELDRLRRPNVRVARGSRPVGRAAVLRAIRRAVDRDPFLPCSVHLMNDGRSQFISNGGGPWRVLLEELGVWDPAWVPPGGTPVEFLDDAGFLDARVLAVHGVQMDDADLIRLGARGSTLVTCPRSNGHTGAGAPPIEDFYKSDVRIAIGTDSLASSPDLNIFAEMATMRALAPGVPASRLIGSATYEGARALGFDAEYGTIEPGKRARLIAVEMPSGTDDVQEALVGGIRPDQIRWIE
jgi:hypothetical protein